MEQKVANSLKKAELELNNAKFVVGCGIGNCVMYERLKRMTDELLDMIEALEG